MITPIIIFGPMHTGDTSGGADIGIYGFSHEVVSPRDATSHHLGSKRVHQPWAFSAPF